MDAPAISPARPASPSLLRSPWVWLLGLVALVVGAGTLVGVRARPPQEGSAEVIFARDMAAHHEQAVEMALILHERSNEEELRRLALDILLTQQAQIGQMQGWLAVWRLPLSGTDAPMGGHGEMMGMASQQQVNALQTLAVPEAEVSFLQLMIRHHLAGVAMAESALSATARPEVERLAQAIVSAQQSEIEYMEHLLSERGAAPLAPPAHQMP